MRRTASRMKKCRTMRVMWRARCTPRNQMSSRVTRAKIRARAKLRPTKMLTKGRSGADLGPLWTGRMRRGRGLVRETAKPTGTNAPLAQAVLSASLLGEGAPLNPTRGPGLPGVRVKLGSRDPRSHLRGSSGMGEAERADPATPHLQRGLAVHRSGLRAVPGSEALMLQTSDPETGTPGAVGNHGRCQDGPVQTGPMLHGPGLEAMPFQGMNGTGGRTGAARNPDEARTTAGVMDLEAGTTEAGTPTANSLVQAEVGHGGAMMVGSGAGKAAERKCGQRERQPVARQSTGEEVVHRRAGTGRRVATEAVETRASRRVLLGLLLRTTLVLHPCACRSLPSSRAPPSSRTCRRSLHPPSSDRWSSPLLPTLQSASPTARQDLQCPRTPSR
mmetsp:Transcript_10493/g.30022  ORF Transcript_10493/g.30022 Transcript_10493/m.30022 type:complete len:388 (+) Transcript_10493:746-1909(+)